MSNFKVFLDKSEEMRSGYKSSLEPADSDFKSKWTERFERIPELFEEIYSVCGGTSPDISEQSLFDFLPGFRLMQIDEILEAYENEFKDCEDFDAVIPFLADYDGGYYAYAEKDGTECIIIISEEGMEIIHADIDSFWKTIIAFYDEGVYSLDEDGFLSYDFDAEGEIGEKYNPGVDYWG